MATIEETPPTCGHQIAGTSSEYNTEKNKDTETHKHPVLTYRVITLHWIKISRQSWELWITWSEDDLTTEPRGRTHQNPSH